MTHFLHNHPIASTRKHHFSGISCHINLLWIALLMVLFINNAIAQQQPPTQQTPQRPPQQQQQQPKQTMPKGLEMNTGASGTSVKADPNQTIQGALQDQKAKRQTKSKDPNEASWFGMMMQDLTARFNRYFNANQLYKEGVIKLEQDHKDNFNEVLPVFVYKSGDGTPIMSNLDNAIKKASMAVQLKPNSKWVDDCYQIIGQSYYLKGDNEAAISSFQYITKNFSRLPRRMPDKQQKAIDKKLKAKERLEQEQARELALKERKEQQEQKKKEAEQKKKDLLKEREQTKKEQEKIRADKQKETAQAQKERKKEAETKKAQQAKTQKERQKEAEKRKKEREKEQKQLQKERKKAQEARKKGKPVPAPKTKTQTPKDTNNNPETEQPKTPAKTEQNKEPKKAAEDKGKEKQTDKSKATPTQTEPADTVTAQAPAPTKAGKKDKKNTQKDDKTQAAKTPDKPADTDTLSNPRRLNAAAQAKGGASGGFLQHKLSKYDAMLWLARTYIENKNYHDAEQVIKIAKEDRKFPKNKLDDLAATEAHYYLVRKDWAQAKIAVQNAIKVTKKKKDKARLYYILAQLNSQDKNHQSALIAFNKVLKNKPPFQMEFNTRLNIAQTKLRSGAFTQDQAVAYLEKLAKENKYADVVDQIYFAMAELAIEKGDMAKATAYLDVSAKNSTVNKDQKALSFLKLADLNYDLTRYVAASAYYDSTLALLPKNYPSYNDISNRRTVLTELVEHLNTIALQDSLQRIAKMPDGARRAYLEEAIAKLEAAAAKKREAEALKAAAAAAPTAADNQAGSTWYFYNPIARNNGFEEFNRRWPSRTLTDNWRLSSKLTGVIASANNTAAGGNAKATDLMGLASEGKLTVDDLLKTLPLKPDDLQKSDTLIATALYEAGMIYRNRLNNPEKAIETLDELLKRYPTSQFSPQTHYTLYLLAKDKNNTPKVTYHKNQILQNYPQTTFAKLVEDPNVMQAITEKSRQLEIYYEQTYAFYKQNKFDEVKKRSDEVNQLFTPNPLQPKFDLLNALIVGHTQDRAAYIVALKDVMIKHPNDEVKAKAQEILSYIEGGTGKPAATSSPDLPPAATVYSYQPAAKQYLVVSFNTYSQQLSGLSNKLSDFNNANFSIDKLKVNQMLLDPQTQIVLIKEFNDAPKAMTYLRALQQNESAVFQGLDTGYRYFVISKSNFTEYFKRKDTDAYYEFFIQNYK